MLSMLYVGLTIKVKVGIPERFKVGWYPHKITGSSHLKSLLNVYYRSVFNESSKAFIFQQCAEILHPE